MSPGSYPAFILGPKLKDVFRQSSGSFAAILQFKGTGATIFVMLQGIIGAFGVRLPVSWFVSRQATATLFHIGLATPASATEETLRL